MITVSGTKHLVNVSVSTDGDAVADGAVTATEGHPFWVPDLQEWVDAGRLQPGQWLRTSAGTWVQVTAVERWTQPATVHNLTISTLHTYYVLAGGTPVLVHNDGEGLTPEQVRSLRSLEARIAEHQAKLDAYRADPWAYDNKGLLANAPNDEVRQRIIQGRINHLETEIRAFQGQADNLKRLGGLC